MTQHVRGIVPGYVILALAESPDSQEAERG